MSLLCDLPLVMPMTQAEWLNWADVIVVPHGATFGNIVFTAKRSVIVHVSAGAGRPKTALVLACSRMT